MAELLNTISVIIPTYNEAKIITRTCRQILEFGQKKLKEIIIVDSPDSTDNLSTVVENLDITVIKSPQKGRAFQMNYGAKLATGDILYFVHADTLVHPNFVFDIHHSLQNGYAFGCYRYRFDSTSLLLKINAFFTRFPFIWCRGGDQTLFIRKKDFFLLDGFREDYKIMEDFEFVVRAKKVLKFRIIPKNVIVSARKYKINSYLRVQWANFVLMRMFLRGNVSQEKMQQTYKRLLNS